MIRMISAVLLGATLALPAQAFNYEAPQSARKTVEGAPLQYWAYAQIEPSDYRGLEYFCKHEVLPTVGVDANDENAYRCANMIGAEYANDFTTDAQFDRLPIGEYRWVPDLPRYRQLEAAEGTASETADATDAPTIEDLEASFDSLQESLVGRVEAVEGQVNDLEATLGEIRAQVKEINPGVDQEALEAAITGLREEFGQIEQDIRDGRLTEADVELAAWRVIDETLTERLAGYASDDAVDALANTMNGFLARLGDVDQQLGEQDARINDLEARVAEIEGSQVTGNSRSDGPVSCTDAVDAECVVPTTASSITETPSGDGIWSRVPDATALVPAAAVSWLPATPVTVTALAGIVLLLSALVWWLRFQVKQVKTQTDFAVGAHAPNIKLSQAGLQGLDCNILEAGQQFTITFIDVDNSTTSINVRIMQKRKALVMQFSELDRGNGCPPEIAVDQLPTTDVWSMVNRALPRTTHNTAAAAA